MEEQLPCRAQLVSGAAAGEKFEMFSVVDPAARLRVQLISSQMCPHDLLLTGFPGTVQTECVECGI